MSIQRLVRSPQHIGTPARDADTTTRRTPRRDASMVHLCNLIARTMRGAAGSRLLDQWSRGGLPQQAQIVALPVWLWRPAGISMGRKDQHGTLHVPVRVQWDDAPDGAILVRPVDPASTSGAVEQIGWTVDALGVEESGTTALTGTGCSDSWHGFLGSGHTDHAADGDDEVLRTIEAPTLDRDAQHRVLCGLIEDGISARWEFLQVLDATLEKALNRAHMALVGEYSEQIYGDPNASTRPVLHEESLEALRSRLVYGADEEEYGPDGSRMLRLITDTHSPTVFDNVDPQRWLRVKIGQIARYWVRREVGDPEKGPKIRRTARELGVDDPETVAAALSGIGTDRVQAALGLAPHPDAGALRFGFGDSPDDDAWIERAVRSV